MTREDAISRQAVQDYIAKYLSQYLYNDVREAVEAIDEYIGELPSVRPQEQKIDSWSIKDVADTLAKHGLIKEQEPKTGHWKLVQRGKSIDICCSNCEKVRIKQYAYNYTIDQLDKEDLEECFKCADMRYCPNCGAKMESEVSE